jgi:hypothetical protein
MGMKFNSVAFIGIISAFNMRFTLKYTKLLFCLWFHMSVKQSLTVREHKLRVLRRIFGTKRDGVTGGWRKLRNEELHNLYPSPSIIRVKKSRRMRWAGHVA